MTRNEKLLAEFDALLASRKKLSDFDENSYFLGIIDVHEFIKGLNESVEFENDTTGGNVVSQ